MVAPYELCVNTQMVAPYELSVSTQMVVSYELSVSTQMVAPYELSVSTQMVAPYELSVSTQMGSYARGGSPIVGHGREVPRWWPAFLRFSIQLGLYFIPQHNPIDPFFCRKKWFVSITFSSRY